MLKFIQNLLSLNIALVGKARSLQAYDEALALYRSKDFKKALPLMKESAELGHIDAMSLLGSMLLLGQGTKEDGKQAEVWLQHAAESGNKDALSLFGMALATGKAGCRKDLELGKKYLTQVAEQGDEQSIQMLDLIKNEVGIFAKNKKSMGKKRPSAH